IAAASNRSNFFCSPDQYHSPSQGTRLPWTNMPRANGFQFRFKRTRYFTSLIRFKTSIFSLLPESTLNTALCRSDHESRSARRSGERSSTLARTSIAPSPTHSVHCWQRKSSMTPMSENSAFCSSRYRWQKMRKRYDPVPSQISFRLTSQPRLWGVPRKCLTPESLGRSANCSVRLRRRLAPDEPGRCGLGEGADRESTADTGSRESAGGGLGKLHPGETRSLARTGKVRVSRRSPCCIVPDFARCRFRNGGPRRTRPESPPMP